MKVAVKFTVDVTDTDRYGIALREGIRGRLATREEVVSYISQHGERGLSEARAAFRAHLAGVEHQRLVAALSQ